MLPSGRRREASPSPGLQREEMIRARLKKFDSPCSSTLRDGSASRGQRSGGLAVSSSLLSGSRNLERVGERNRKRPFDSDCISDDDDVIVTEVLPTSDASPREPAAKRLKFAAEAGEEDTEGGGAGTSGSATADLIDLTEETSCKGADKSLEEVARVSISDSESFVDLTDEQQNLSLSSPAAAEPAPPSPEEAGAVRSCLAASELLLLVDRRERKQNATYRGFFRSIREMVAKHANVPSEELTLTVGDFALVSRDADQDEQPTRQDLEEEEQGTRGKREQEEGRRCQIVIERKTVDDIVSRSAEKEEGPHFRQERILRAAGCPFSFFLLEGELEAADRSRPRVLPGKEEEERRRLDVISRREDLLRFLCGLVCRNYRRNVVLLAQTFNAIDSAMLLAALSKVFNWIWRRGREGGRGQSLSLVQHKWSSRMRSRSEEQLAGRLQGKVAQDMVIRVLRRFGSEEALMNAYVACKGREQQRELLVNLSPAACNSTVMKDWVRMADMEKDSEIVWRSMIRDEEEEGKEQEPAAAEKLKDEAVNEDDVVVVEEEGGERWRRYVEVSMCQRMNEMLEKHKMEAGALFLGMDVVLAVTDHQVNHHP
eukprot:749300-Hanusia_phi.AAC.13